MVERYVVLGDVVHSRDIEDREAFQRSLRAVCARVNDEHAGAVSAEFTVLKGIDEVGGVLSSPAPLYDVVTAFQEGLRPNEVRLAVASGGIDVGAESRDVTRMDGEAFHRASERLEALERDGLVFDASLADRRLARAVADEINLLLYLRDGWTDHQREVVEAYRRLGTQQAAAAELGVTQQAVSNTLARAAWPLVETVEGRLRETLAEMAEDAPRPGDAAGRGSR